MALTNEEIDLLTCKLRIMWLRDLLTLYIRQDDGTITLRTAHLKEMLRNAEADEIALTDTGEAERHRKMNPER